MVVLCYGAAWKLSDLLKLLLLLLLLLLYLIPLVRYSRRVRCIVQCDRLITCTLYFNVQYIGVVKDCKTADTDVAQCMAGFFGGQRTGQLPEHYCNSSEKVFRQSMFSAVCAVQQNSAFLGLFHYPRPLVKHRKDFDSTELDPRHLNHYAYG